MSAKPRNKDTAREMIGGAMKTGGAKSTGGAISAGGAPSGFANCPVLAGAMRVQELTNDLQKTMRRLRTDLKKCGRCEVYADCPVLAELNAIVQTALDEVIDEWNLHD